MLKVALLEDDRTMLSLLTTLLQIEGYQPLVLGCNSNDFSGMLAILCREQPDLALVDVHLCQLDGFDLLAAIRQDSVLNGMRVLMTSGIDVSTRSLQAGADGFLLKPYMPEELIAQIQHICSA
jgi:DNA-binding response OmpR family regulator